MGSCDPVGIATEALELGRRYSSLVSLVHIPQEIPAAQRADWLRQVRELYRAKLQEPAASFEAFRARQVAWEPPPGPQRVFIETALRAAWEAA